jgi:hypothetical protein
MAQEDPVLYWNPSLVGNLAADHGIHSRCALAERLEEVGIAKNMVYRHFDENWAGEVLNMRFLVTLSRFFSVPYWALAADPIGV